jgi:hypothetical protein
LPLEGQKEKRKGLGGRLGWKAKMPPGSPTTYSEAHLYPLEVDWAGVAIPSSKVEARTQRGKLTIPRSE